jgi:hypothetical protein
MHGAAVKLPEVFDLRQFIDESGREQNRQSPRSTSTTFTLRNSIVSYRRN